MMIRKLTRGYSVQCSWCGGWAYNGAPCGCRPSRQGHY